MKVGFYLPDFSGGGNERAAVVYARHWPPDAEPPTVIARSLTGPFVDDVATACEVVGLGLAAHGLRATVSTPRALAAAITARRIDVLLAFLSLPSLVAAKAWARRLKVVWSVQTPALRPIGAPGETRRDLALQRFQAFGVRAVLRGVDGLHVPTAALVEGLGLRAYNRPIGFVPNGIEPAVLESGARVRATTAVPNIVSVGRLAPSKRFDLLIDAVGRVVQARPVTLTIFGVGPLLGALRDQAQAAGLADSVRFAGFEQDLARVYGEADAFVLASDYEAFGNVVVEALSFGLPAVVTDAPFGPAEIVDHGRYGLVVERNRPDLLAEAILRVLPGGPDHDRLSSDARARAAGYAGPLVARQLHGFLAELAG
jgi:glycosyltransferase involved in cell wall biosynthesis